MLDFISMRTHDGNENYDTDGVVKASFIMSYKPTSGLQVYTFHVQELTHTKNK